jgi:hypothetical protein
MSALHHLYRCPQPSKTAKLNLHGSEAAAGCTNVLGIVIDYGQSTRMIPHYDYRGGDDWYLVIHGHGTGIDTLSTIRHIREYKFKGNEKRERGLGGGDNLSATGITGSY